MSKDERLRIEMQFIITKLTDAVVNELKQIKADYEHFESQPECIESIAKTTNLRIRYKQTVKIKKELLKLLKSSTNRMILCLAETVDN